MKIISLTILFAFLFLPSIAQVGNPKEVKTSMSQGNQTGWKILVPEADGKTTQKAWEKLMKQYDAKSDKVKRSDDILSENAVIPSIQERPLYVYSQFNETPEGVYVTVFFDLGGAYLNSKDHKDKVGAVQKLLKDFATDVAKEVIEAKVKEEEKNLEKLEKDQKDLKNDQSGYEKDIVDAEETIRQRKKDIEDNKKEQEAKAKEIEEQKAKLEEVKKKLKKL